MVDYHSIEKLYQIPTSGLKYDDLTPEQRAQYEDAFDDDDEVPEFISGSDIDTIYFNKDTTRRIQGMIFRSTNTSKLIMKQRSIRLQLI